MKMGRGAKIGISIAVVLIGAFIFGVLRELVGHGEYMATAVEVFILIWIWTRPG